MVNMTNNSGVDNSGVVSVLENSRLPLTFLIILLHSYFVNVSYNGIIYDYSSDSFLLYQIISFLFSQLICRIAVPGFFLISGFFFFLKLNEFSAETFKSKLIRRVKTLIIPYILWNAIFCVVTLIAQKISPASLSGNSPIISELNIISFLKLFWAYDEYPICVPMWYIRDLFVVAILSPVIFFLIKKIKCIFPIVLLILWLLELSIDVLYINICTALTFFSIGAYLSQNNKLFIILKRYSFIIYYSFICTLLITLSLHFLFEYDGYIVDRFSIIVSMSCFFCVISKLSVWMSNNHFYNAIKSHVFFIYAVHDIPLAALRKVMISSINPLNNMSVTIVYFSIPVIIFLGGLGGALLLKTITPKLYSTLIGGR